MNKYLKNLNRIEFVVAMASVAGASIVHREIISLMNILMM